MHDTFSNAGVIVVAHYSGLTVAQMTDYRARMRAAGGAVKVTKNRLAKLAIKGTDVTSLEELFNGPTVMAYSDDPVAAAKVSVDFAKENDKLVILGGAMGTTSMNADAVKSLASLPSLDELRGKLIGLIEAPASKIARVVNEPAAKLARVTKAKSEQNAA